MEGAWLRKRTTLLFGVLLAVALTFVSAAWIPSALADEEITFRIVGFGDQDCRTGSNRLVSGDARPFEVEVCVTDDGSPISGQDLTAVIVHADGKTEEIAVTTGPDGTATFEVVPVDAGLTTVEICDSDGCDHGVLEMEASGPPPPPVVASYHGPTTDMGPSELIGDGEDDFDDPYTGGVAAAGSGDPAMDIASFRYLGVDDGVAHFEVTTRGDACGVFSADVPFAQFSIDVTTPDGGSYSAAYRVVEGEVFSFANSDGAPLEGVAIGLGECVDASTVILGISGVDVPPGSTVRVGSWLSLELEHSGYQDFAAGSPIPAVVEEEEESVPTETETAGGETGQLDTALPALISSDDEGSFPIWIPIVVLGVAIGGFFVYRSKKGGIWAPATSGSGELTADDLEQYRDADLASYTDVYAPAGAVGTVIGTRIDDDWLALLDTESRIQERYMDDLKSLLGEVVAKYKSFHAAITLYKEKFVRIASGSTSLQGYLQEWSEVQGIAKKQDLAFGIITLVWGAGSLGLKGLRWLRAPKAAAGAESGAARVLGSTDELATTDTVLAEGATVVDGSRPAGQLDKVYDAYAAEVGIDGEAWIERFAGDFPKAQEALINIVARSRGWHGITDEASGVLNRLLVNGRSAIAGRGATLNPADIAKLREWASTGDFWNRLLTAGGMLEDGAVLFYNVDDVKFLKALLNCEGDLASLRPLVGPAQETALVVAADVAEGIPGLADVAASALGTGVNAYGTSGTLGSMLWGPGPISGLDLSTYTDQFGGWASSVDEGFGSAMLDGVWGIFTSPFETYQGITMTAGALDKYNEFLGAHGGDLVELGSALNAALNELKSLRGAIEAADLDDPTSSLGGKRAQDLRDVMGQMDEHLENASDDWKAQHGEEVEARKAHIEQKISDTTRMLDALQNQLGRLGQMYDWLDGLRKNPDGTLREVTSLWNPELLVRLGSVDLALQGIIGSVLLGGGQPNPASAAPTDQPNVPDPFSDDYRPFEELDAQSQEEYEAETAAELDEVFRDWSPGEDE